MELLLQGPPPPKALGRGCRLATTADRPWEDAFLFHGKGACSELGSQARRRELGGSSAEDNEFVITRHGISYPLAAQLHARHADRKSMKGTSAALRPDTGTPETPPTLELLRETSNEPVSPRMDSFRRPLFTGIVSCILCLYFSFFLTQLLPGREVTLEPLRILVGSFSGRFLLLLIFASQVFLSLVALAGSIVQLVTLILSNRHHVSSTRA